MRKKVVLGCLLPLGLLGGLGWWGFKSMGGGPEAPAHYEVVDRGDVDIKVTETGAIEPLRKVEIKSKVAGRITRMLVDAGSRVALGQVLVNIDPTEINSQGAQIQAQLDGATARLKQAEKGAAYQRIQTSSGVDQARE